MKAECGGQAAVKINQLCKTEIPLLRWLVLKRKAYHAVALPPQQIKSILAFHKPEISDPVFDFPKQAEFRREKYNAKRKALDENKNENLY